MTMKAYTDLEQSKRLAEILPLESADMEYLVIKELGSLVGGVPFVKDYDEIEDSAYSHVYDKIACWSLTALLSVLPKIGAEEPMIRKLYYASKPVERYICEYGLTNMTSEYDNPVDACVEMIIKLKENELI